MCLTSIDQVIDDPTPQTIECYKLLIKRIPEGNYIRLFKAPNGTVDTYPIEFNKWYKAVNTTLPVTINNKQHYKAGFHCFVYLRDALYARDFNFWFDPHIKTVVMRVKVKGIHTYGYEGTMQVLVADECMYIEENTSEVPFM